MARDFRLFLSFACLALAAAVTFGCGGGSLSPLPSGCTGPYDVVGPWQGTLTNASGNSVALYGAIDSAGMALFFNNSKPFATGDTAELPTITGACSFSGNMVVYAEPGGQHSGKVETDSAQGNVNSPTSITASFIYSGTSYSGSISLSSFSPLNGTVTALQGSMLGASGAVINGQAVLWPLTFTTGPGADMSFTGSPVNCAISGTFTQVGTSNVFDVSITLAGTGCALTGTFSGLGFESDTDYFGLAGSAQPPYLYADVLASSSTFVLEIYPFGG